MPGWNGKIVRNSLKFTEALVAQGYSDDDIANLVCNLLRVMEQTREGHHRLQGP